MIKKKNNLLTIFIISSIFLTNCNNSERVYENIETIINPPSSYKPISYKESTENVSNGDIKRITCNLIFKDSKNQKDVEDEIRFWVFKIWSSNQDAKAIIVKCFLNSSSSSFKTGTFAPQGIWSNANEENSFDDYHLLIK